MSPLTLILLAAAAADRVDAERAAMRIQEAQYGAAVERRAQHREIERIQPMARADVKSGRGFSDEERAQFSEAILRLARCATGKLAYDRATGFYVPEQKDACR